MKTDRLFGQFPGGSRLGNEEASAVADVVLARSPFRYYGPGMLYACERAESRLSELLAGRQSLVVSSGTAALHSLLAALGVKPGDEVVIPAYAWVSDLMAVLALGAMPVIAPVDKTLCLDPDRLRECLTKSTRAVIAVHMRGRPADMGALSTICTDYGIALVEDAAQCLGGSIGDRLTGCFGDGSILSFQLNKMVTSGEGGAVLTGDEALSAAVREYHNCGLQRLGASSENTVSGRIEGVGLNYRMSELQAAVLVAQLGKLDEILAGLGRNIDAARSLLAERVPGFRELPFSPDARQNGAFLCFSADGDLRVACEALRQAQIPAEWCGVEDPHHYASWVEMMTRRGIPFRAHGTDQSRSVLAKSAFVEIASQD